MREYFKLWLLVIICISVTADTKFQRSTTNNDFTFLKETEGQCYAYCFAIVQPILQHTVRLEVKDQEILQKTNLISSLEKRLYELQSNVGIKDETIKSKDFQLSQQMRIVDKCESKTKVIDNTILIREQKIEQQNVIIKNLEQQLTEIQFKVGINEETIKNKDLQLSQQNTTAGMCQNETKLKNNIIDKLQTEVKTIGQLQTQIKELIENMEKVQPSNCIGKLTDIYAIKVPGMFSFSVPCDSSLAGSGWTVIQRRKDGSENFDRNWRDYRLGFGDLSGEFFIGLDKLNALTKSQAHELYIYMHDIGDEHRYARYSEFLIGDESDAYKLKTLGTYSGDAGDALGPHINMKFSTPDRDNTEKSSKCAGFYKSGWWFTNCFVCNLNEIYTTNATQMNHRGIKWNAWHFKSLRFVQMMIRPKNL